MAIDYGAGGSRGRAYDRYASALQMKLNAENQRRAQDIEREGLFGTGIKTSHIKGVGDSLMSAYKIAHAAKKEKLAALKDQHKSEMDALYKGIDSLPDTKEGAKQRQALGLYAIKAQENFNNQYQQFSDKSVTEFTRGGRESMVLKRLPKQTLNELETALSGESEAKVDGIMNTKPHGDELTGEAAGTFVPPQIPIGHDIEDDDEFYDFQRNNQKLSPRQSFAQKNLGFERMETPSLGRDAGIMNTSRLPETNPADYNNNEVARWQRKFRGQTNRGVQDIHNQWNRYD